MTATKFQTALIAEDDDTIRAFLDQTLREMGYTHIGKAGDGEKAWEMAAKFKYDLIITDWKMPKVHGLALLNRLRRSKVYPHVPVLIISGFLNRKDFTLLDEFPLTEKLEKPFTSGAFNVAVTNLEKEYHWQMQARADLSKIVDSPVEDQKQFILQLLELVQSAPNPMPVFLLGARILSARGDFRGAESVMRFALKQKPKNTLAMFELAKILLKLKRNKEAFELLQRAQAMSPDNLDRVCLIGEMHLNKLEHKEAQDQFQKALRIDPQDKLAKHGLNIANNVDRFLTQNPEERLGQSFSTLLNMIGISLVRKGQMDEGIEHYKSAMAYVDDKDVKAKLSFNAALGNMRKGDFRTAKHWLDMALSLNGNYPKAELYLSKLDQFLESGHKKRPSMPSEDAFDDIEMPADMIGFALVDSEEMPALPKRKQPKKPALAVVGGKTKSASPKEMRKNIITACPHAQELFKMLSKNGVNTLSIMDEFQLLYDTYGAQLIDKAFRRAVRELDPMPHKVKAILEEMAAVA